MSDVPHLPVLPAGVVREATAPEQLVVVWARRDVSSLLGGLRSIGLLPVLVEPADTLDLVSVSGSASLLLVESDLLDESTVALLRTLREGSHTTQVCILADDGAGSAGLLTALRAGITDVVDPGDPAALATWLHPSSDDHTERVLAIGAHPDDVEIGCGATLLQHRTQGHAVTVLTLSRGAVGGDRETRRRESVAAAAAMHAELLMGDLPDTQMEDAHEMIGLIEDVIRVVRPDRVYVHSGADDHQDHRAVHRAAVIAARRVPDLYCYQSPSSRNGFAPTKFVTVDDTIEGKVEVLASYRSQSTRHYLEPDLVRASARYWARQLTHARFAEPFEVLREARHG